MPREHVPLNPVPIFPLPDLVLIPGAPQPLHIFEPRYRQMVSDILDGSGLIVLGTVLGKDRRDLAGSPSIQPIAGLGVVEHYETLEDGRYNLLLRGLARVEFDETVSDRLYRTVVIREIEEEEPLDAVGTLRRRLHDALQASSAYRELGDSVELPLSRLADLLLLQLDLKPDACYGLFALPLERRIHDMLARAER